MWAVSEKTNVETEHLIYPLSSLVSLFTSSTRSPHWYYCSPHLPALLIGTLLFTQWVSLLIVRWQILAAPSVSSSASPFSQSSTTCTLGQKFSNQFSLKSLETQSNWLESKRLLGNSWHISTNVTLVY